MERELERLFLECIYAAIRPALVATGNPFISAASTNDQMVKRAHPTPKKQNRRAVLPGALVPERCQDLTFRLTSQNQLKASPTGAAFYITNASPSSSRSNTGKEQPAISTRPAASIAAWGETP